MVANIGYLGFRLGNASPTVQASDGTQVVRVGTGQAAVDAAIKASTGNRRDDLVVQDKASGDVFRVTADSIAVEHKDHGLARKGEKITLFPTDGNPALRPVNDSSPLQVKKFCKAVSRLAGGRAFE